MTDSLTTYTINRGHGRLEGHTLQTSTMLNDNLAWPRVGQVCRLDRKFGWVRQGLSCKTSCEVVWGITSLSRQRASPLRLLAIRRRHWRIETGLHYRHDVTVHDEATRMPLRPAGGALSMIHALVLGFLTTAGFTNAALGRHWFAGHLHHALALLIGGQALS